MIPLVGDQTGAFLIGAVLNFERGTHTGKEIMRCQFLEGFLQGCQPLEGWQPYFSISPTTFIVSTLIEQTRFNKSITCS